MNKILIDIDDVKLVLEALENSVDLVSNDAREAEKMYANVPTRLARVQGLVALEVAHEQAITALREALAEQPAQQDNTCSNTLRIQGKAYPRTCKKCGLGPCVELVNAALDKKAENARELGLDYEPAPVAEPRNQEPVAWIDEYGNAFPLAAKQYSVVGKHWKPLYTYPPAQRTWVGLTTKEIREWWASENGLEDCLMAKLDDFEQVARAIEAKLKELNK